MYINKMENKGPTYLAEGDIYVHLDSMKIEELEKIIKNIKKELSAVPEKEAKTIVETVDTVHTELMKPKPRWEILKKCVEGLGCAVAITDKIPTLVENIKNLIGIVSSCLS